MEAESLNKGLLYMLAAAVLGVLLVVTPLFALFGDGVKGYYATFLSSRFQSVEDLAALYGFQAAAYIDSKVFAVLAVGLATAIFVYLLVKARFSH